MGDARLLKCGCELRKDALDLLYDTDMRVRMRGGRDITPALTYKSSRSNGVFVMGLVEAFNVRHGTTLVKDKNVTCSDWGSQHLSLEQLEYAALDAWMSFRVGQAQRRALLKSGETCHIHIPEGELSGALRDAGRLLRECQVVRDGCRMPIAHVFDEATWIRRSGELQVCMAEYENKLRTRDRVEVTIEGSDLPLVASAVSVRGKMAVLQCDRRLAEQQRALFRVGAHPVVKDITRVRTNDHTGEFLMRLIKDLVGRSRSAGTITGLRFATKYLLGGTYAAMPPSLLPRLAPQTPSAGVPSFQLNEWQASCVNDVVAGHRITLTLGQPGTGKTTCIAAVASSIAERSKAGSDTPLVVITTQQNVAALNVLRALMRAGYKNMKLVVGRGYYIEWHEHEYSEQEENFIHVPVPRSKGNPDEEDGEDDGYSKPTPRLTKECAITILTLGYAAALAAGGSSDIVDGHRVGAVLVDEASQAWSAHALILDQAFHNMQHLHLFGDDKQLPPVLNPKDTSPAAKASNAAVRSMYDEARDGRKRYHALQVFILSFAIIIIRYWN